MWCSNCQCINTCAPMQPYKFQFALHHGTFSFKSNRMTTVTKLNQCKLCAASCYTSCTIWCCVINPDTEKDPSKCWEPLTQWLSITSQKIWIYHVSFQQCKPSYIARHSIKKNPLSAASISCVFVQVLLVGLLPVHLWYILSELIFIVQLRFCTL